MRGTPSWDSGHGPRPGPEEKRSAPCTASRSREDSMGTSTEDKEGVRESAVDKAEEKLEEADEGTDPKEAANGAVETLKDTLKEGAKSGGQGLLKSVVSAAREAAQEVLEQEAKQGAKQAAEYLSQKAPELAKEQIEKHGGGGPAAKAAANFGKAKLEGAGGPKAVASAAGGALKGAAENVKDKVSDILPGGGGGDGDSSGGTRRLPIMYAIDIGVPVERVYNEWTQFEESPEYMHRLQSVDQSDPTRLKVTANVWGRKRSWDAEIVEQIPNERIEWRTKSGSNHHGVVTFHELDEHLTRVLLTLDFPPQGLVEKMGSGLRIIRRAAIGDLKRFKAQLEMRDEERGAWRGRIEEGEVVSDEDAEDPEARADDQPEDSEDEQAEGSEDEQPEDEDVEEPEAEEELEEEDEEPEAEEELDEEDEEDEEVEDEPEAEAEEEEEPEAEEEEEPEPEPEPKKRSQPRKRTTASSSRS